VLPGLAIALQDVIRPTTQQQQQQRQQDWRLYARILHVLRAIPAIWGVTIHACPAMMRTILPAVLPLLQQLQRCGQLLPTATAALQAHSSSSSVTGGDAGPHQEFIQAQQNVGRFLAELVNYVEAQQAATGIDVQMPGCQLLRDPAVSELLIQLLAVHTVILHKDHVAHRQQQRDRTAGSSSSSSNHTQQQTAQVAKQQRRADLLSIPAFHQHPDMLQLLPGGQAYLDAAEAACADYMQQQSGTNSPLYLKSLHQLHTLQKSAVASLECTLDAQHNGQAVDATAAVLSAAALRLVLQLQLLAACYLQRQRATKQQQEQEVEALEEDVDVLLVRNNHLLHVHIRAVLQCTGSSSLQPEVLQQAGLQLLQALAAPLQQLQLCSSQDRLLSMVESWQDGGGRIAQQLFALQAAAAGMFELIVATTGKPCAAAIAVVHGLALVSALCSLC
jgi:hypothetical protein